MKLRILTPLMLVLLMFSAIVSAQDDMLPEIDPCFGLSEADCDDINQAYMTELSSFNMTFGIDFSLVGLPEGPLEFTVTGNGPFALDLMSADVFSAAEMDLTMDVSFILPEGASMDPSLPTGELVTTSIHQIMVDGVLYQQMGEDAWMALPIAETLQIAGGAAGLPIDPGMFQDPESLDPDALGDLGLGEMTEGLDDLTNQLSELISVPGFITYERDGQTFMFVTDFRALFTAPEFSQALQTIASEMGEEGQMVMGLGMLAPMLIPEGRIEVVQVVDDAANAVTRLEFTTDLSIQGSMLDPNAFPEEPIVIDLDFWVEVDQLNESFDITAPEGVEVPDMSGMGGM